MKIYTGMLMEQQGAYIDLSEEAIAYLRNNLHLDNVAGIKHVMRHLYVADYERRGDVGQSAIRAALLYALNCVDPARLNGLIEDPYDPIPRPRDMRMFFTWWWEALFGDESFEAPEICSAEVAPFLDDIGHVIDVQGHKDVSPDVVKFPRTDGHPPGYGAPPPDKISRYQAPPLPRRPTDGARFFRWEDQAKAIKRATRIHKKGRQQKVWVAFEFPIGEGYQTGGGDIVWETNYACVRFYEGKPVDSWPDLRKGWQR